MDNLFESVVGDHEQLINDLTRVDRNVPPTIDHRLLFCMDHTASSYGKDGQKRLKDQAREACQLLINSLFNLPHVSVEGRVCAALPEDCVLPLPRTLPVPKVKQMTRWERFATQKGIKKVKKSRMVFDEASQDYVPRYGYAGGKKDSLKDWLIEVPQHGDQAEDQFAKKAAEKKSNVDKNQMQQRRNQEEALAARSGVHHKQFRNLQLKKMIIESKGATASMGRFDKKLHNEDVVKVPRQKRKFDALTLPDGMEKEQVLRIADKVNSSAGTAKGKDNLIIRKAVKAVRQGRSKK